MPITKIKNAPNLKKVWKVVKGKAPVSSLTKVEHKTMLGIKRRLK